MAGMYTGLALGHVDFRTWSALDVFEMNLGNIALPSYAETGSGLFFDILHFLNGRGSTAAESLTAEIGASWTGAGAVEMGIDADTGRVYIESDTEDFAIPANADNVVFGFDAAGHALVGGGAPFRRVAPDPFDLSAFDDITFEINPAVGATYAIGADRWFQDVITSFRGRATVADADDDNATGCLEAVAQTASGTTSIHIGLNATGRVVIAWDSTVGGIQKPNWLVTGFRDALGFTGNEAAASSGNVSYVTAERAALGVQYLPDGVDDDLDGVAQPGSGLDVADGSSSYVSSGRFTDQAFGFVLEGPAHNSAEHHRHWLRRVRPADRAPFTIYPRWPEVRRRRESWAVTGTGTSDTVAHDLLHTTRGDGYHGRLRGYVRSEQTKRIAWESGGVRDRFDVSMVLREAP